MNKIIWSDRYSVNNTILDEQHKRLFSIIDSLQSIQEDKLPTIIQDLLDYSNYHFTSEEQLMREAEFEGLEEHVQEHKLFFTTVDKMHNALKNATLQIPQVQHFLVTWLIHHIEGTDRKYTKSIEEMGQNQ